MLKLKLIFNLLKERLGTFPCNVWRDYFIDYSQEFIKENYAKSAYSEQIYYTDKESANETLTVKFMCINLKLVGLLTKHNYIDYETSCSLASDIEDYPSVWSTKLKSGFFAPNLYTNPFISEELRSYLMHHKYASQLILAMDLLYVINPAVERVVVYIPWAGSTVEDLRKNSMTICVNMNSLDIEKIKDVNKD